MFFDVSEAITLGFTKAEFTAFEEELLRVVGTQSPVSSEEYETLDEDTIINKVYHQLRSQYDRKNEKIAVATMPQIKHVHETMSEKYQNIVFPLTDGRKEMQLVVNLKEAYESQGRIISTAFEKNIVLSMIDNEWKEHLREMDDLRSAVHNAQYEQKDPLLVYKLESFELFKMMLVRLNAETMELLMKLDIPATKEIQTTNKSETTQSNYEKAHEQKEIEQLGSRNGYQEAIQSSEAHRQEKQQPVVAKKQPGRNDACPCGSGKKYKQCHGK